jgi:hypothetical protein
MNISDSLHKLRIFTGCLLAIINRTRAFIKFKMAARLSRVLYLKSELLS